MKQTIRLYREHDVDLYYLYFNEPKKFYSYIRQALRLYVEDSLDFIQVPELKPLPSDLTGYGLIKLDLTLNDSKDAKSCSLIQKVKPYNRNMFIKTVLRRYLKGIDKQVYALDDAEMQKYSLKWEYTANEYDPNASKKDSKPVKPEKQKKKEGVKGVVEEKEEVKPVEIPQKKAEEPTIKAEPKPAETTTDTSTDDDLLDFINSFT